MWPDGALATGFSPRGVVRRPVCTDFGRVRRAICPCAASLAAWLAVWCASEIDGAASLVFDRVDEAIEDDELDFKLYPIHARLESTLKQEHAGALNAQQDDVEGDDEEIGVDQLPQDRFFLIGLRPVAAVYRWQ